MDAMPIKHSCNNNKRFWFKSISTLTHNYSFYSIKFNLLLRSSSDSNMPYKMIIPSQELNAWGWHARYEKYLISFVVYKNAGDERIFHQINIDNKWARGKWENDDKIHSVSINIFQYAVYFPHFNMEWIFYGLWDAVQESIMSNRKWNDNFLGGRDTWIRKFCGCNNNYTYHRENCVFM